MEELPLEKLKEFPPYDEKYIYGILKNYYPQIKQDASLNKFMTLFEKPEGAITQYIDTITQDVFRCDEKFVVVNVGMGGGKTSQTIDYLRSVNTFIWATPNQALSYNTHTRICESESIDHGNIIFSRAYKEQSDYINLLTRKLATEPQSFEVDAWKREIMRAEQKILDIRAFCATIKHYNRDFKYRGDYKTTDKPDKTQMDKADKLLVCLNSMHYINPHEVDVIVIDEIETFLHQFFDNER